MQPWSYNNSRRLGFASAIHRIYTPHDSTDMDPRYDQLIRAAKYRFIYKYLGFLRWAVRLRDCHRRKTSSQVRERVTTVPWLHDNTWNFIVSKIKRDCCGKYIYSWPQFSFFGLLLKSCIHLHYSEHRRLEVMYFVQTDGQTYQLPCTTCKASTSKSSALPCYPISLLSSSYFITFFRLYSTITSFIFIMKYHLRWL